MTSYVNCAFVPKIGTRGSHYMGPVRVRFRPRRSLSERESDTGKRSASSSDDSVSPFKSCKRGSQIGMMMLLSLRRRLRSRSGEIVPPATSVPFPQHTCA